MKERDEVYATYYPERFGIIVRLGPEVSEVRWHGEGRDTYFISNHHLRVKGVDDERNGNRKNARGRKRRD